MFERKDLEKGLVVLSSRGIAAARPLQGLGLPQENSAQSMAVPVILAGLKDAPAITEPTVPVFDIKRMKKALSSPVISVPPGLSRKEVREHILNTAKLHRKSKSSPT